MVGNTSQPETTDTDSSAYGFAVSHSLPLRGQFSTSFNRSYINSQYLGYNYNGTIDTINGSVSAQPTNKLHLTVSANYTDNLNGVLYQSIVPTTGAVLPSNEQSSSATDLLLPRQLD